MGPQLVHPKIRGFFRMHHEPTRKKLMKIWAARIAEKQPIEQIREYFGEKITLYFVFIGSASTTNLAHAPIHPEREKRETERDRDRERESCAGWCCS